MSLSYGGVSTLFWKKITHAHISLAYFPLALFQTYLYQPQALDPPRFLGVVLDG